MASSSNNLTSNTTAKVARVFTEEFEASRVLTKTVNIQTMRGEFTPQFGSTVQFKRPHDYKVDETTDGDISSTDKSDIISGTSVGTVQNYMTVHVDWTNKQEALQLDQLKEILAPAAARLVTKLELNLGEFMFKQGNLHYGTPGTVVDAWSDVAGAGALMDSIGVPNDGNRFYTMNPFTTTNLADAQRGLSSGSDSLVNTAWQNAHVSNKFGNMMAMTSNALPSYTSGTLSAGANRAGTLSGTPDATYATHKDSMIQTLAVTGFGAGSDTIKAGEIIQVTARNRLGLSTRTAFTDATGAQILWSGTVTADVTLSSGAGNILVAGAAINETNGQYNTVASALTSGDVVTIINAAASTVYQPNMFYHRDAFGLGTVVLPKIFDTDTSIVTKDGIAIKVTKYGNGDTNVNKIRFDILPIFATFNPFFAGQGFGV